MFNQLGMLLIRERQGEERSAVQTSLSLINTANMHLTPSESQGAPNWAKEQVIRLLNKKPAKLKNEYFVVMLLKEMTTEEERESRTAFDSYGTKGIDEHVVADIERCFKMVQHPETWPKAAVAVNSHSRNACRNKSKTQ